MTFTIVARCRSTGLFGVAISTAVPAVGWLCPYVRSGVGMVVSQGHTNLRFGADGLDLLEAGRRPDDVASKLLSGDPHRDRRQLAVLSASGELVVRTGSRCSDHAGQRVGTRHAVFGNLLVGAETLDAMEAAHARSVGLPLHERLMMALEAGQAAGGDARGRCSAAILVQGASRFPALDVRVDDHTDPVTELRRVLTSVLRTTVDFTDRVCPAGGLGTVAAR